MYCCTKSYTKCPVLTLCKSLILTEVFGERWELVDVLAGILAAGDAEAKLKIETLEELLAEVVPLDHAEVVDGLVADGKLHPVAERRGHTASLGSSSSRHPSPAQQPLATIAYGLLP